MLIILDYQILQAFCRTIGWPALHENALKNSGMLLTTPLIRYFSGEGGLVTAPRRRFSGRGPPQAHGAIPIKNRWSGVKPSMSFSALPSVAFFHAMYASCVPPKSAMSSPMVSLPLILMSSTMVNCEYSSDVHAANLSNFSPSSFVHQSRRLPLASN